MANLAEAKQRYMRDPLPIRLGALAANLARVNTFSHHDANKDTVFSLLNESKYFIEWTAAETELDVTAQLVDLQIQLALWQNEWSSIWSNIEKRQIVAQQSRNWSDKVLELSGLIS